MNDHSEYTIHTYKSAPYEVVALRKISTLWHKDGFWDFDSILKTLSSNDSQLFYIVDDKVPNHWASVIIIKGNIEFCEIIYIYTCSDSRKKHLAHSLLQYVIELKKSEVQINYLVLEVRPSNTAAIGLYESLGFIKLAKRLKYYSNEEDALIYRLDLKQCD